ncbi:MAG: tRNA uridine-5-carboxymethylaminomethyl(34) synthesis GTPase MnmE [Alphaproteobacteria bacterium]|nr:tRNA uridine-5-carboxymethylaminomethyl(34) synthesis GTPase MnmE [Alphaproteobacteria bacterium]
MVPDLDTIFALASGAGRAGIAVVRSSGPQAASALRRLSGRAPPEPRRATLTRLTAPDGEPIDQALVLWFAAPASFTGEDVVEYHLHGGRAVLGALAEALRALGQRPAEPGEFSRRAFHNQRLDLTAAEGIADLVAAETAAQRRQALRQMDGALVRLTEGWRDSLILAQARLEAAIDFSDEADVPADLLDSARADLARLRRTIAGHLADGPRGAPNVGKSSLLKRLARRDAAIVSARAGTTRDVVEVHMELAGWPVVLADTAGLRDTADEVEGEGIRRALARAETADLKLAVFDSGALPEWDEATRRLLDDATLVILNKVDTNAVSSAVRLDGRPVHAVSAATGVGLDGLEAALAEAATERLAGEPVLTRARHRAAFQDCVAALARAEAAPLADLLAEDVRLAARALGRVSGRVDVEDLLDVIFREFCIGK